MSEDNFLAFEICKASDWGEDYSAYQTVLMFGGFSKDLHEAVDTDSKFYKLNEDEEMYSFILSELQKYTDITVYKGGMR